MSKIYKKDTQKEEILRSKIKMIMGAAVFVNIKGQKHNGKENRV